MNKTHMTFSMAFVGLLVFLVGCNSQSLGENLEIKRRNAVLRSVHGQLKQLYFNEGTQVLDLPDDVTGITQALTLHSSLDPALLHFNTDPIDVSAASAPHTILLDDSADAGDGTLRVILFADGHIETAARSPIN